MKQYLSDIINELPANCIYNKNRTGAGGTTIAIESKKPYIICVPFVNLIENKMAQYPNERYHSEIFGFYGGVTKDSLEVYLRTVNTPKILVTYDSLPKLMESIDPMYFSILIDEYHLLFNQYSFRRDAAMSVLKNFRKFKEFTFMSATPIEEEFILEELKDIPVVNQKWKNSIEVNIQSVKCDNVESATVKLILAFLNGQEEGNGYFFVNSVEIIKKLIKKAGLNEDNCRVIYSKNNKTKLSIHNGNALDKPKKINLITSTCFEGADFFDEDGRIIIVSDPSKSQTMLDIGTSIHQIIGRIRDSKYINWVAHLYNTTRYTDMSYEEFKEKNFKLIQSSKNTVEQFNQMNAEARKCFLRNLPDGFVNYDENGFLQYDPNMALIDIFNYKLIHNIYRFTTNLEDEYYKHNFNQIKSYQDCSIKIDLNELIKPFRDVIKEVRAECEDKQKNSYTLNTPILDDACIKYPWLPQAIEVLGFNGMATLQYNISKIKDALLVVTDQSVEVKTVKKLNQYITLGMWYSKADLKKYLQQAYDVAGINKTAKATEIEKYFVVEEKSKYVNATKTSGFVIISKNYLIHQI